MKFGERLQQVINELDGGNVSAFSRSCGISNSTISSYLDGTNIPKIDKVAAIAEKKQISLDWLVLGRGKMRLTSGGEPTTVDKRVSQYQQDVENTHVSLSETNATPYEVDGNLAEGPRERVFDRLRASSDVLRQAAAKVGWLPPVGISEALKTLAFIYRIRIDDAADALGMIKSDWDARGRI